MNEPLNSDRQPLLVFEEDPDFLSSISESEYGVSGQQPSFDQPPPYTPTPSQSTALYPGSNVPYSSDVPVVKCRVCYTLLNVDGKLHLHVVKCHSCGEATPIRPAPPTKKYVRCTCHCLLICNSSSQRIVCPRVNCKRIISLASLVQESRSTPDNEHHPLSTSLRIVCGYCNFIFHGRKSRKYIQLCPRCQKRSFLGKSPKQRRIFFLGLLVAVSLIVSAILSYFAFSYYLDRNIALDIAVGCMYCFTILVIVFLVKFYRIKISEVKSISTLRYT